MAVQERENCCHHGWFACICEPLMKQADQILRLAQQGISCGVAVPTVFATLVS